MICRFISVIYKFIYIFALTSLAWSLSFLQTNNFWIKRQFISRAQSTLIDYHSNWHLMNFVDVVKVSKVHCLKKLMTWRGKCDRFFWTKRRYREVIVTRAPPAHEACRIDRSGWEGKKVLDFKREKEDYTGNIEYVIPPRVAVVIKILNSWWHVQTPALSGNLSAYKLYVRIYFVVVR